MKSLFSLFKALSNYKNELYGKGERKPLNHKERQKRKAKRRNNKRK